MSIIYEKGDCMVASVSSWFCFVDMKNLAFDAVITVSDRHSGFG